MIKEHNKLTKQEEHPTILVTPETNLSATSIFWLPWVKEYT